MKNHNKTAQEEYEAHAQDQGLVQDYLEEIQEIPEVDFSVGIYKSTGKITKIGVLPRNQKFPNETDPSLLYVVEFEVDTQHNMPSAHGEEIYSKTSGLNPKSKLYKHKARYGTFPKLKQTVECENTEMGYWKIVL